MNHNTKYIFLIGLLLWILQAQLSAHSKRNTVADKPVVVIDNYVTLKGELSKRDQALLHRKKKRYDNNKPLYLSYERLPEISPLPVQSYLMQYVEKKTPIKINQHVIKEVQFKPRHIIVKTKLLSRPHSRVSPQHWTYKHFSDLVRSGYIKNIPLFFFMGGKTFNRGDLAKFTKEMVERLVKGERIPDPQSRKKIKELLAEFQPELKEMKTEVLFGYREMYAIKDSYIKNKMKQSSSHWGFSGSSTSGYTDEFEKQTNNWNNSVVVNINRKKTIFNMGFTTNEVDLSETTPGLRETKIGKSSIIGLDKYSLEDERSFMDKSAKLATVVGFTPGMSFSEGLTVGNMSLEGASFSVFRDERDSFDLLIGHTQGQDADKLLAIHYSGKIEEKFTYHLQAAGALYDDNSTGGVAGKQDDALYGFGMEFFLLETELNYESVLHRTRSSHYLRGSRSFKDILEISAELRYYDGVSFDYNSPDVYAGISGGDDVFDRGFAIEGDWQYRPNMNYIFNFDTTFNGPLGDLIYFYNELAITHEHINTNISYEREWTDLGYNHISTLRLSRDWSSSFKTTLDWSRENVDLVGSDSVRISGIFDAIKDILSFSMSYSARNSDSGSDVTKQFGINWSKSLSHFFSLQMSLADPDASTNNVEVNYLYKF